MSSAEQGSAFVDEIITLVERTPAVLRALLAGLPRVWTDASEGPDTFTPFDVVGHLIHGERTDWIPRTRIILAQGQNRTFEPYDRFAQQRASAGMTMDELLETFAELRAQNVAALRAMKIGDAALALEGQHPELGTVTLRQLLSCWPVHDLGHLGQISRVMAKRYRDEVGPWRAYLTVLDR